MMNYINKLFLATSLLIFSLTSCEQSADKAVNLENSTDFHFHEYTIAQLQDGYQNGRFSIEDVVQAYLDRIEKVDRNGPELRSILMVNPDAVLIARKLDQELSEGNIRGPMHGIPVLLKDNIDTHDKMPATAGSRALKDSYPLKDSFIAKKLREAGAIILGKANLSEWANFRGDLSSSGWSGVGGQTKNPYVLSRNPCGSSSGSGVAVSANLTMLAIGTETNGSVVCPSNNNGIVGIKPTVGLLSRSGIIPISFTQDTPGPMARTVEDAAICLGVMTGVDPEDEKTTGSKENFYTDYTRFLDKNAIEGKRIGIFTAPLGINYKVDTLFWKAVDFLRSQGAELVEIDEIAPEKVDRLSLEVMLYEYKDGLNRYFTSLGPDAPVKNLEELIDFNRNDPVEMEFYNQIYLEMAQKKESLNSAAYKETLAEMLKGSREEGIDRVMDEHDLDAIVAPTGGPAWQTDHVNGDHFQLSSSSPAAQSGYPNITVPMGFIEALPVGISFFGRAWSEPELLSIAYAYEQGTQHRRSPEFLPND